MDGKWIWIDNSAKKDSYGEFIAEFESGKKPVLEISADSEYAVYLNDKYVYSGQYADFPWYKVYDEIDLSDFAVNGKNTLKILVWYVGNANFCHYNNRPALYFAVKEDGKVLASSGKDTLSRKCPKFVSWAERFFTLQIGYSFEYDAEGDGEAYSPSAELENMPEKLFKRPISRLMYEEFAEAKRLVGNVYDVGRETVGYPVVELKAAKGQHVIISFGERLVGGEVPRLIGGRDFSFEIIGNGEKICMFNPLRKLGLRYFSVEGDCEIYKLGLLPVVYPFKDRAFTATTGRRQQIYDTAKRTLRLNAFEHYFDCPWREQGFYALDSRLQMKYGYSAFENTEFQYGALKLMSEDRHPEGVISIVVPTSETLAIPSFSLFYLIAMEEYAEHTGDNRLIDGYFDKIESVFNKFAERMEGGLVKRFVGKDMWNFYEWSDDLLADAPRFETETDCVLNLNTVLAAKSMKKICAMLKKTDREKYYDKVISEISIAVNKTFFDEERGLYKTFTDREHYAELTNAYAVLTGVASGEVAKNICETLVKDDNGLVACTLSMLTFKYDALLMTDKGKYTSYVLSDIDRKYGFMLDQGSTSFWETILGGDDFGGAGSLCHGWSALPALYYPLLDR
ncbi:MAG: family 78 glycoside hydrolase catalytic domain [Clostridia bacterium]|nr:family 78 glycoside hydrolase catalytic domain [Clostridia bacterium]